MLVWIFLMCPHKMIFFRIHISGQFSCPVVSDSLWPHGLQHARPPCPSPTPKAYSNSRPLSQWCHPAISSSVIPFSSCLQSFPASGSFQMSQFFASGGQSIGVSASASVLPMKIQDWFSLGSPFSPRDSQESSPTPQFKSISSLVLSFLYSPAITSIHDSYLGGYKELVYWEKCRLTFTTCSRLLLSDIGIGNILLFY